MATVNVTTSQNLSAVTYALGDTINIASRDVVLDITATPSVRPFRIQCSVPSTLNVKNASTTTPLVLSFEVNANSAGFYFTAGATLNLGDGTTITVATSTGTANAVLFNTTNIGGVDVGFLSGCEVETAPGSNIWEIWPIVPEYVTNGVANVHGFNKDRTTAGTISVTTGGVVTGVGTAFTAQMIGLSIRPAGATRDFAIVAYASTTSVTLSELNGAPYSGGAISAGTTYFVRNSVLIDQVQVGNQDLGKVLFCNPITGEVRAGDNVNGTLVPSGCRVRIPNVIIKTQAQQTTLATAITSSAAQAITLSAAVGPTTQSAFNGTVETATLLIMNGATVERIHYTSRSGNVVSASGMTRGVFQTAAQSSFPIGSTVYYLPSSGSSTWNGTVNLYPGGILNVNQCIFGLTFNIASSSSGALTVNRLIAGSFKPTQSGSSFQISGVTVLAAPFRCPGAYNEQYLSISNMLANGVLTDLHLTSSVVEVTSNQTAQPFLLYAIPHLTTLSRLKSRVFGNGTVSTTTNRRAINITACSCSSEVTELFAAGASVLFQVSNMYVKTVRISTSCNSAGVGSANSVVGVYSALSSNLYIRDVNTWPGGMPPRESILNFEATSKNIVVSNKGFTPIDGAGYTAAIAADNSSNTILSNITVTNAGTWTSTTGVLLYMITASSGGTYSRCLIDSLAYNTNGTGVVSKGGTTLDVVSGPHRVYNSVLSAAMYPALTDVQPIVVFSNVSGSQGYLFVGPFAPQVSFDCYSLGGTSFLDTIGRIYVEADGDSVIIKSTAALRGFSSIVTSGLIEYNYNGGSGTNPVPADCVIEFRLTNWGTPNTGAWTALTLTALEEARAALPGFSSSVGVDLQLRYTYTGAVTNRALYNTRLPVVIDTSYNPPVGYTQIGVSNAVVGATLAGYDNSIPASPVLKSSNVLTGTSGYVSMPFDYDPNSPGSFRLVCRKPDRAWVDSSGTYLADMVTIPANGMPAISWYVSSVTDVSFDHVAKTITVATAKSPAEVASAYRDSLTLLANMKYAEQLTCDGSTFVTSTYTVSGGANVTGPYTDATGTSTYLTLTGLVGAAVAVYDGTGARYAFSASVTGTYALSLPPGQTGTWSWKVCKYGLMPATGTFAPNTGAVTAAPATITDTGITQSNSTLVAAYTDLTTPDMAYDALAMWETTSAGIDTPRLAVKSGSALDFGARTLTLDATAAGLINVVGSAVTLHSSTMSAGTTMRELTATGGLLGLLHGASIGSTIYTDSSGRWVLLTTNPLLPNTLLYVRGVAEDLTYFLGYVTGVASIRLKYATDEPLQVRAMQCTATTATLFDEVTTTLTSIGASVTLPQANDPVYAANGRAGSGVPGISINDSLMLISVTAGTAATLNGTEVRVVNWADPYAYETYWLSQDAGIVDQGRIITALDTANYVYDGFKIRNDTGYPLVFVGGWARDKVTGTTAALIDASGGSIISAPDAVLVAPSNAADTAALVLASLPDAILGRNIAGGSDGGRTVRDALRALRNKTVLSGTELTVYQEDDATPAWTAAATLGSRDPITGIDPA